MVWDILVLACVGFMGTGSRATQQSPYFETGGEGAGVYLGGLSGAVPLPLAYSSNYAGSPKRNYITNIKPGSHKSGVLPGNVRFALSAPTLKGGDLEKQSNIFSFLQQLLSAFTNNRPSSGNRPPGGMLLVFPQISQDQWSQILQQFEYLNQETKHPTEQYGPVIVSSAINGDVLPPEEAQGPEVQLANSGILQPAAGEEVETVNEVIPVAVGDEAAMGTGTNGLKNVPFRRRPGVVYLVPKGRLSKGIEEEGDESTVSETTTPTEAESQYQYQSAEFE